MNDKPEMEPRRLRILIKLCRLHVRNENSHEMSDALEKIHIGNLIQ